MPEIRTLILAIGTIGITDVHSHAYRFLCASQLYCYTFCLVSLNDQRRYQISDFFTPHYRLLLYSHRK